MLSSTDRPARARRSLARAAALAVVPAALGLAGTAHAAPPTVTTEHADYAFDLAAGSLCAFRVTFTGEGTVRMTTHSEDGVPVRTTVHGALHHTLFSEWATLHSPGPAPVSTDLTTGQQVITGMQYAFILPGHGPVMMAAGRMVIPTDGTPPSLTGLDRLDAEVLCDALGPG